MKLDLGAVVREAAARWRQDRALLLPLAGLFLFVPQWAVLLLVPPQPPLPTNAADAAAMLAWGEAARGWAQQWGPLMLAAAIVAQWAQLTLVALYVGREGAAGRPTVAAALGRAGLLLLRYVAAQLVCSLPIGAALLVGLVAPPMLLVLVPAGVYVLGRTLLVGPALLSRRPMGAMRAIVTSWGWTRGNGAALALFAGMLVIVTPVLVGTIEAAGEGLRAAHLGNPVVLAALDAVGAAIAAGAMLALAMGVGVLYRRLAR